MPTDPYLPPYPTDEMSLRLLIEACAIGDNEQTNLLAFLEMGAEIATEEWLEEDVVERTFVEGKEPFSPQHVIDTLARELLAFQAAHDVLRAKVAALDMENVALKGPGGKGWAERAVRMEAERDAALAKVAALEEDRDAAWTELNAAREQVMALEEAGDGLAELCDLWHITAQPHDAYDIREALARWREVGGE